MGKHVQGRDLALFGESRAIPIFLLTTLLISSVFYFLIIKSGHMGGGWGGYVAGLMWSPGLAALLTCKLLRRDLDSIGWGWGKTRYEVIGYLIPLGYSIVIYTFVWLTGLGGVYNKSFVDQITNSFGLGPIPAWASITLYFIFTATFTVIRDFATVIGEEIGWRGFLVPELAKEARFPRDCHDHRIYLGNLALSSHLVCRLSWGLTGLVLCSVVDGNAAVSDICVDLASPQVQKYLALRPSSCITQHLHTTVLRPPHNLSEQNGLCSGRVWRRTTCNLNCDGDLLLEATR
jgi:membrane protease YdiL (CAAX protease family)